ncbi:hypothetical protein FNF29_01980 [Cafeteria roenbergensis]|uniref:EF-hand domain-containing protein n=1 Tax=Cafeteria roenbergensis TaxID=33653 RepID=A0A5A8CR84_CAFRO|nr:hypothetical protein FNF29_01980 [Cafeteria roenbergensis]|eukprot:KAA0155229.1 hypothetical protein FNF29_01980 [Cafeteria roenbergensis]
MHATQATTGSALERHEELQRRMLRRVLRQRRDAARVLTLRRVIVAERPMAAGTLRFGSFLAWGKRLCIAKRDEVVPMVPVQAGRGGRARLSSRSASGQRGNPSGGWSSSGTLGLSLGVGLVCDGKARDMLGETATVRTRGSGVFWPREDYVLPRPVPAQWLAGLAEVAKRPLPGVARALELAAQNQRPGLPKLMLPVAPAAGSASPGSSKSGSVFANVVALKSSQARPGDTLRALLSRGGSGLAVAGKTGKAAALEQATMVQARRRWNVVRVAFARVASRGGRRGSIIGKGSDPAERSRARRLFAHAAPHLSRRAMLSEEVPMLGVTGSGIMSINVVPRLGGGQLSASAAARVAARAGILPPSSSRGSPAASGRSGHPASGKRDPHGDNLPIVLDAASGGDTSTDSEYAEPLPDPSACSAAQYQDRVEAVLRRLRRRGAVAALRPGVAEALAELGVSSADVGELDAPTDELLSSSGGDDADRNGSFSDDSDSSGAAGIAAAGTLQLSGTGRAAAVRSNRGRRLGGPASHSRGGARGDATDPGGSVGGGSGGGGGVAGSATALGSAETATDRAEARLWLRLALSSPSALFAEWAGQLSERALLESGLSFSRSDLVRLGMRKTRGSRPSAVGARAAGARPSGGSSSSGTDSLADSSSEDAESPLGSEMPKPPRPRDRVGGTLGWLKAAFLRRSAKNAKLGPPARVASAVTLGSADVLPTEVTVDGLMLDVWRRDQRAKRALRRRRRRWIRMQAREQSGSGRTAAAIARRVLGMAGAELDEQQVERLVARPKPEPEAAGSAIGARSSAAEAEPPAERSTIAKVALASRTSPLSGLLGARSLSPSPPIRSPGAGLFGSQPGSPGGRSAASRRRASRMPGSRLTRSPASASSGASGLWPPSVETAPHGSAKIGGQARASDLPSPMDLTSPAAGGSTPLGKAARGLGAALASSGKKRWLNVRSLVTKGAFRPAGIGRDAPEQWRAAAAALQCEWHAPQQRKRSKKPARKVRRGSVLARAKTRRMSQGARQSAKAAAAAVALVTASLVSDGDDSSGEPEEDDSSAGSESNAFHEADGAGGLGGAAGLGGSKPAGGNAKGGRHALNPAASQSSLGTGAEQLRGGQWQPAGGSAFPGTDAHTSRDGSDTSLASTASSEDGAFAAELALSADPFGRPTASPSDAGSVGKAQLAPRFSAAGGGIISAIAISPASGQLGARAHPGRGRAASDIHAAPHSVQAASSDSAQGQDSRVQRARLGSPLSVESSQASSRQMAGGLTGTAPEPNKSGRERFQAPASEGSPRLRAYTEAPLPEAVARLRLASQGSSGFSPGSPMAGPMSEGRPAGQRHHTPVSRLSANSPLSARTPGTPSPAAGGVRFNAHRASLVPASGAALFSPKATGAGSPSGRARAGSRSNIAASRPFSPTGTRTPGRASRLSRSPERHGRPGEGDSGTGSGDTGSMRTGSGNTGTEPRLMRSASDSGYRSPSRLAHHGAHASPDLQPMAFNSVRGRSGQASWDPNVVSPTASALSGAQAKDQAHADASPSMAEDSDDSDGPGNATPMARALLQGRADEARQRGRSRSVLSQHQRLEALAREGQQDSRESEPPRSVGSQAPWGHPRLQAAALAARRGSSGSYNQFGTFIPAQGSSHIANWGTGGTVSSSMWTGGLLQDSGGSSAGPSLLRQASGFDSDEENLSPAAMLERTRPSVDLSQGPTAAAAGLSLLAPAKELPRCPRHPLAPLFGGVSTRGYYAELPAPRPASQFGQGSEGDLAVGGLGSSDDAPGGGSTLLSAGKDGRCSKSLPPGLLYVPLPGVVPDSDRRMRRRARLFRHLFRAVDPEGSGWADVGELRSRVLQEALRYELNSEVAADQPPRRKRRVKDNELVVGLGSSGAIAGRDALGMSKRFAHKQWPGVPRRSARFAQDESSSDATSEASVATAASSESELQTPHELPSQPPRTEPHGSLLARAALPGQISAAAQAGASVARKPFSSVIGVVARSPPHSPEPTVATVLEGVEDDEDDEDDEESQEGSRYEDGAMEADHGAVASPQRATRGSRQLDALGGNPAHDSASGSNSSSASTSPTSSLRFLCSEDMVRSYMATWLLADEAIAAMFNRFEQEATGRVSEADWVAMGHAAFAAFSEPGHPLAGVVPGWAPVPSICLW